jgi:hypothetical protein
VNLSSEELAQLVRIVNRIHEGKAAPRADGRVGQFLRGCEHGRLDVQHLLARHGISTRDDGWVPGDDIGPIELRILAELKTAVPSEAWGPVETAPVLSEQLGGVAELTLWTDARAANHVRVLFARDNHATVRLAGRYRWFAPSRVTPGESSAEIVDGSAEWDSARCLKAVAEDVGRPPHPLEYVLDYRLGNPGLKVFRAFVGRQTDGAFEVLPASSQGSRRVRLAARTTEVEELLADGSPCLVFASREPWDETWQAIAARQTSNQGCFDHVVTWADFRAEVLGQPRLSYQDVEAIRAALTTAGMTVDRDAGLSGANLTRSLVAPAVSTVRWFRFHK